MQKNPRNCLSHRRITHSGLWWFYAGALNIQSHGVCYLECFCRTSLYLIFLQQGKQKVKKNYECTSPACVAGIVSDLMIFKKDIILGSLSLSDMVG